MGTNKIVFWEIQRMNPQQIGPGAIDGFTVVAGDVLNSATATFLTDGVIPGDELTVGPGADAGTYIVESVPLETQLTIIGAWPVGGGGPFAYDIFSSSDFYGLAPATDALQTLIAPDATHPLNGVVRYSNLMRGGRFDFEAGIAQWGTDPLTDWIQVEQFRLYLDITTPLTAMTLNIVSPEGDVSPIFLKGWASYFNAAGGTGSGDQDTFNIQQQPFVLRPGCHLELNTTGAARANVQAAEVWWSRKRVVIPNSHGDDYFAYNG